MIKKFLIFLLTSFLICIASEYPALQNITQLTFTSMGFEKAGESYFSPDGKTIIFQAVPKGQEHYQIYTLKIGDTFDPGFRRRPRAMADKSPSEVYPEPFEGPGRLGFITSPEMVSTGKGACTCAYFRPDGKKIIFASSHSDPNLDKTKQAVPGYKKNNSKYSWEFTPYMNIYEANLDGSELKALTTGPAYKAECAYSSDGKQIVFASNEHGKMNLYTMNSDGTNQKQITFEDNVYIGGPFFSPDDKRIIYRADYEKEHYLQIYCIDADGKNRIQLTNNGAVNWAPYWHPNGKVIAYTTSLHGHHNYEIYLINIETGVNYRLTYSTSFDGLPSFSKDGNKIIWTSKRSNNGTCQIFLADFVMPDLLR